MKLVLIIFLNFCLLNGNLLASSSADEVVVYSSRAEHLIKPLFDAFTKDSGIKVKYLTGKGNALIERIKLEGVKTNADMLMVVDAGNLWYAGEQGLFQSIDSDIINTKIPAHLRDTNGLWVGLSVRARTIVYSTDRAKEAELSTYAALATPKWHNRLCLRTAKKIYTKSLVASILYNNGVTKTKDILKGWVANLAATPNAKDSHIMNAIAAGQCDVGLVNSYYFANFLAKNPNTKLKLFWANQNTTGVHVNVSGAGITKYAKHPQAAKKLLEYLATDKAQVIYAQLNKEYPANPNIAVPAVVANWGSFTQDKMNLAIVGQLQSKAVKLMQRNGYK